MGKKRLYTGGSGQLVAAAELLARECNAAIPFVDTGTDVFAFQDEYEQVARIQVKTSNGVEYRDGSGYWSQFTIPLSQLRRDDSPALYYALVTRVAGGWRDTLIIKREILNRYRNDSRQFGTESEKAGELKLRVQFRGGSVVCSEVDLTMHRNAWDVLPPVRTPSDLGL